MTMYVFSCFFEGLSSHIKKPADAGLEIESVRMNRHYQKPYTFTAYVRWFRKSRGVFWYVTSSLITSRIIWIVGSKLSGRQLFLIMTNRSERTPHKVSYNNGIE